MSCVRSINCLCIGRCSLFCNQIPSPSQFIIYCQQRARHGVSPSYFQILFHASSSSQSIFCIFPSPKSFPYFWLHLVTCCFFDPIRIMKNALLSIIFFHDFPSFFQHLPIFPQPKTPASACACALGAGTTGASGGDEAFEPWREDLLGRFLRWSEGGCEMRFLPPILDGWNLCWNPINIYNMVN